MTQTTKIGSMCGVAMLAFSAHADFTGICFWNANDIIDSIPNQSVPEGYNVWRIYANFNDPLDAFLNVTVDWSFSAAFYQHPLGGDGPPNPDLFGLPGFETLAADTFVTHGVSQLPIDNLGFDPDFEMLPNGIIGGWFDSNPLTPTLPDANGQILFAQLTLPTSVGGIAGVEGGHGTIFYEDAQSPGTATPGEFTFVDSGPCIPAPTAGLVFAAAIPLSRRHDRSRLSSVDIPPHIHPGRQRFHLAELHRLPRRVLASPDVAPAMTRRTDNETCTRRHRFHMRHRAACCQRARRLHRPLVRERQRGHHGYTQSKRP